MIVYYGSVAFPKRQEQVKITRRYGEKFITITTKSCGRYENLLGEADTDQKKQE